MYLLRLFQQLLQLPLLAHAPMTIIAFRLQLLSCSDNRHGRTSLSVIARASFSAKIIQQYNYYFLLFFCFWEAGMGFSKRFGRGTPIIIFGGNSSFLWQRKMLRKFIWFYIYEKTWFSAGLNEVAYVDFILKLRLFAQSIWNGNYLLSDQVLVSSGYFSRRALWRFSSMQQELEVW